MAEIIVTQPAQAELDQLGIAGWSPWGCERSTFDWTYEERETCYLHAGRVNVRAAGRAVHIKAGDLVVFPKGLSCTWEVLEPVRKVYRFGA